MPTSLALEVINRKFMEHIDDKGTEHFFAKKFSSLRTTISLLELVSKSCVFSFQGKFYQQLQGATMGYLVSPVNANIYMEYFKELALGPESLYLAHNGSNILMMSLTAV